MSMYYYKPFRFNLNLFNTINTQLDLPMNEGKHLLFNLFSLLIYINFKHYFHFAGQIIYPIICIVILSHNFHYNCLVSGKVDFTKFLFQALLYSTFHCYINCCYRFFHNNHFDYCHVVIKIAVIAIIVVHFFVASTRKNAFHLFIPSFWPDIVHTNLGQSKSEDEVSLQ